MAFRVFRSIPHKLSAFSSETTARLLFAWFATPAGQKVLASESRWLAQQLGHCWGETLLHVMLDPALLREGINSQIRCVVQMVPEGISPPAINASTASVVADLQEWPFNSESIPIVVLHHSLELAVDIHQVLREAARVLIPGGHLIVLGFNPWSRWGVMRVLRGRLLKSAPWVGRMMSPYRLVDWLQLLDFDVELSQPSRKIPASTTEKNSTALHTDYWAGYWHSLYGIFARKRSVPLTPEPKRWRTLTASFMPLPVAQKSLVAQKIAHFKK